MDKPHLKWHPKHWHIRRIPIPQDLIGAIAEHQRQNPGSKLIFPNGAGNPDEHLLRIVQRIAKRAGGTYHADLHTFRRTYATLFSGTAKIQTIQYLLSHKDIKTTMRYLGIADLNSPEPQRDQLQHFALATVRRYGSGYARKRVTAPLHHFKNSAFISNLIRHEVSETFLLRQCPKWYSTFSPEKHVQGI